MGPSTLATLFNHMWPRIVADPSTLGRHVAATCMLCMQTLCLWWGEPQPVAHLSHKLQCARQSLKIMVSYGNKYPRHNARPHVVEQSGQCARALRTKRGKLSFLQSGTFWNSLEQLLRTQCNTNKNNAPSIFSMFSKYTNVLENTNITLYRIKIIVIQCISAFRLSA